MISAWDKVFFYFCKLNINHSFLWIIESDTFIPSIESFRAIHELYSSTSDLVVQHPNDNIMGDISGWAHWILAVKTLPPPWYQSMTNLLGLSRRVLSTISDFVRRRGFNVFHEFVAHSLSINLNLTVVAPMEFDTLTWNRPQPWDLIDNLPNSFFHPVKDWTLQKEWHEK